MAENISAKIIDIEVIRGNDISFFLTILTDIITQCSIPFETSALSRLCYHIQS